MPPVRLRRLEDRHEVAVAYLRGGPGFLLEPLLEDEVAAELALQHLQRHRAVVAVAVRLEDEAHAALTEHRLEPVRTERVSPAPVPGPMRRRIPSRQA